MRLYQHYKGDYYELLAVARDEATGSPIAVYSGSDKGNGHGGLWVRPMKEFDEWVAKADGEVVRRFTEVHKRIDSKRLVP